MILVIIIYYYIINVKSAILGAFLNLNIVLPIYVSLIITTLKRLLTGCIKKIFKTEISTLTVAKTTGVWWINILTAIIRKHRKGLLNAVNGAFDFLIKNAARAHSKRDRKTGVFQYRVEPNF
ncbi:hypothetical protein PA7559_15970 [Pseudoalteromonas distincta]